jgi:cysteine-rich secretory family protein
MQYRKAICGFIAALFVAGTLAVLSPPAGAVNDPGAEGDFVARTNSLRASRGLPGLSVNGTLAAKARNWAEHMAAVGAISHSNLSDGAPPEWQRLGENVGRGPSVDAIHNALVASPEHYANLTDPGFQSIGVGVVNANGTYYVSEVFMESASQPAPSAPAPRAATPSPGNPQPAHQAPAAAPAPSLPPGFSLTPPTTVPTYVTVTPYRRSLELQGVYRVF